MDILINVAISALVAIPVCYVMLIQCGAKPMPNWLKYRK